MSLDTYCMLHEEINACYAGGLLQSTLHVIIWQVYASFLIKIKIKKKTTNKKTDCGTFLSSLNCCSICVLLL